MVWWFGGLCRLCPDTLPPQVRHSRRRSKLQPIPLATNKPRSRSRSPADVIVLDDESDTPDVPLEGLWQCDLCDSLNLSRALFCWSLGCGARRTLVQRWKPGDWFCSVCGNHNFANRTSCRWTHCPSMTVKPGDWFCPACGNHNYAGRAWCNRDSCRHAKPNPQANSVWDL